MSKMRRELCSSSVSPQLRDGDPPRQRKERGKDVQSAQVNREAPSTHVSREGWVVSPGEQGGVVSPVSQCSGLHKTNIEEWIWLRKNIHILVAVIQTGPSFCFIQEH